MARALLRNPIQLLPPLFSRQSPNFTHLRLLHEPISKPQQADGHDQNQPSSFAISYLVDSCGLSPQTSLAVAKRIRLTAPEKPNRLLDSLKTHGFTKTQIAKLITRCPILLSFDFDRTLKPKFDYLLSLGYSPAELAAFCSAAPHVLTVSLENRLKRNFELLSSIIGSKQKTAAAFRRASGLAQHNLEVNFLPNIRILQSYGVPDASIALLAALYPRVAVMRTEQFRLVAEMIKGMGFNPDSTMFVHGVAAMANSKESTWSKKMELYLSLGWSEEEVFSAFAKQPFFITQSDGKIRKATEFYAEELHWGPSYLSANPVVLTLSLEKRVIPRCSVMGVLISKGLVAKDLKARFLLISEKDFLKRFMMKYKNQVPEVFEIYKSMLKFTETEGKLMSENGC